ncbi:MAG: hypothetical protein EI684_03620 [Candidatus Viridilinea halotolerans]|uniref:DUF3592 domain-containing protein n=1 Tax=Candidatus Viridilinea halotolerans TaxID=2491704 RepID=A0A426U7I4_9CHLR|nr:MAG: hypothetical protein EI684_03620 [Candidatus Viridilinea halotolerans]
MSQPFIWNEKHRDIYTSSRRYPFPWMLFVIAICVVTGVGSLLCSLLAFALTQHIIITVVMWGITLIVLALMIYIFGGLLYISLRFWLHGRLLEGALINTVSVGYRSDSDTDDIHYKATYKFLSPLGKIIEGETTVYLHRDSVPPPEGTTIAVMYVHDKLHLML